MNVRTLVFLLDIMVCTGCCGTLDFIVTHLFKTLSKRRKKNLSALDQQPPCLRILESHPEMIQQVCARDFTRDLARDHEHSNPDEISPSRAFNIEV